MNLAIVIENKVSGSLEVVRAQMMESKIWGYSYLAF